MRLEPRFLGAATIFLGMTSGCGSAPKAEPKTAQSSAATTGSGKSADATMPPQPNSPTASAISIDETILKACGIDRPKAHFAFDSANIQNHDTGTLDEVARCFIGGPLKGRMLKVVGHADPRGETEYNFVLGNSRADAVGGFLQSRGMDKAKIGATSRGELDATGTDEAGWARDRHVNLLLAQ